MSAPANIRSHRLNSDIRLASMVHPQRQEELLAVLWWVNSLKIALSAWLTHLMRNTSRPILLTFHVSQVSLSIVVVASQIAV